VYCDAAKNRTANYKAISRIQIWAKSARKPTWSWNPSTIEAHGINYANIQIKFTFLCGKSDNVLRATDKNSPRNLPQTVNLLVQWSPQHCNTIIDLWQPAVKIRQLLLFLWALVIRTRANLLVQWSPQHFNTIIDLWWQPAVKIGQLLLFLWALVIRTRAVCKL
jgi:hypothetical protein